MVKINNIHVFLDLCYTKAILEQCKLNYAKDDYEICYSKELCSGVLIGNNTASKQLKTILKTASRVDISKRKLNCLIVVTGEAIDLLEITQNINRCKNYHCHNLLSTPP